MLFDVRLLLSFESMFRLHADANGGLGTPRGTEPGAGHFVWTGREKDLIT